MGRKEATRLTGNEKVPNILYMCMKLSIMNKSTISMINERFELKNKEKKERKKKKEKKEVSVKKVYIILDNQFLCETHFL